MKTDPSLTSVGSTTIDGVEAKLLTDGWAVMDLPDPAPVLDARAGLLEHLRAFGLPTLESLDDYHRLVTDDAEHIDTWHALSEWFWHVDFSRPIVERNLDVFRRLLGTSTSFARALRTARRNRLRRRRPHLFGRSLYVEPMPARAASDDESFVVLAPAIGRRYQRVRDAEPTRDREDVPVSRRASCAVYRRRTERGTRGGSPGPTARRGCAGCRARTPSRCPRR